MLIEPPTIGQCATSLRLRVSPVDTPLIGTQALHLDGKHVDVHPSTDVANHTCCSVRGRKTRQSDWYTRRKVDAFCQEKSTRKRLFPARPRSHELQAQQSR